MGLFQPAVPPLREGIDLTGKVAVVTGATAGIGLEISRQLLERKISTLVLAVRNVSKGEAVKATLIKEPAIASTNPGASIKVMQLDTEDYASVKAFVAEFNKAFTQLHILMLNAGIGSPWREFARTGHERNVQINYLSNVLLTLGLAPVLEATATKTGAPGRITLTGSRMYALTSLDKRAPLQPGETVLGHFDSPGRALNLSGYMDSKFLWMLFQMEMAQQCTSDRVIVNNFCPGMIDTGMTDVLPMYFRVPVVLVKAIRARTVDKAGWIALNAAVVTGAETHGKFLADMNIEE